MANSPDELSVVAANALRPFADMYESQVQAAWDAKQDTFSAPVPIEENDSDTFSIRIGDLKKAYEAFQQVTKAKVPF